jgi:DNA-binding transcriptional MocR family regulator
VDQSVSLARRAAAISGAPQSDSTAAIPFDSGHAFPGILPDLTQAAERALTKYRTESLNYGERPGLREMREWVAAYLTADGARTAPDEVLMSNGAKHGIELICRLLLDEGDAIVVTAPTYVWITLPSHIDGDELAKRAAENAVTIIAGSKFFAGEGHPRNHIRLAYSHATPEEIDEGVRRVARAYASMSERAVDVRESA